MKKQILLLLVLLLCGMSTALAGKYYVTIDPEGAGSVDKTGKSVFANAKFTITATANAGFAFAGWYIGGELLATDNPHTFTMAASGDMYITAKFNTLAASNMALAVKAGCEGMGTVSASPVGTVSDGVHKYTSGTEVTINATPSKGYQFDRWELADGTTLSTAASYKFNISSDMTVYAVFSPMEHYNPELISFPGAEGYGRFTTGGRAVDSRGSKVYYVTRLDDCPNDNLVEGTFRWAVKSGDDTPRTVLFKVAGTIFLTSNVDVKSNTTIAGQTAPGGGICLAGYRVKLGSNIIIRHIRFRAGDLPNKSMSPLGMENVQNVILDHCSFSWSMEENLTAYDNNYTTIQWCITAEGLYDSRNNKGSRAYAAQWGGEHSTMHHCLIAHANSRSPRFNGVRTENHDRKVDSEFLNNVIFNWGKKNSLYGGENYINAEGVDPEGAAPHYDRVYMINNYFRPGPATQNATSSERYFVCPSGDINHVGQWYLKGNKFELSSKWRGSGTAWSDAELKKVNEDNYYGLSTGNSSRAMNFDSNSAAMLAKALMYELPAEYQPSGVHIETADEAYAKVCKQAGASLPRYDEVDARILAEAAGLRDPQYGGSRGSKLGIIDSPSNITLQDHDVFAALYEGDNASDNKEIDVTCYPRLQATAEEFANQVVDTDGDGLPDAYETSVGLNPNDPGDGQKLAPSGYSNLEMFLNGVADGTIDVKLYTKHRTETAFTAFNAIVGEGEAFTTVQAAVDAAPADATPYYIFVKRGTYVEHVQINRSNVHITGQDKTNTIISWNKTHNEDGGTVYTNATVNVGTKEQTVSDVSFDNLTIRNTRTKAGQALALFTNGDRIAITSCNLEGYQDTWRTSDKDAHRQIARNCKISGRTDFIYNRGEIFFDSDTLHIVESGGYIVAPGHISPKYGYVFRDNVITGASSGTQTYLGRPWTDKPKVSFINTRLTSNISIYDAGWVDMDGLPSQMAECNTMNASGSAVDLTSRKTSFKNEAGATCTSKAVLGKVEADSYKLDYMLRGTDNWDADWQTCILPAPQVYVNGNKVMWNDQTGYARCFLVTANGKTTLTSDHSMTATGTVSVQAISAYGVMGKVASSDHPSSATTLRADVNNDNTVDTKDMTDLAKYIMDQSSYVDENKADLNGDGMVNVADVLMLIGIILGQ